MGKQHLKGTTLLHVTVIAGLWVSILFFLCEIVCDYYAICTYTKLEYLHFLEECVET